MSRSKNVTSGKVFPELICERDMLLIFYPQKDNEVTERITIKSSRAPEGMKFLKSDFPDGEIEAI